MNIKGSVPKDCCIASICWSWRHRLRKVVIHKNIMLSGELHHRQRGPWYQTSCCYIIWTKYLNIKDITSVHFWSTSCLTHCHTAKKMPCTATAHTILHHSTSFGISVCCHGCTLKLVSIEFDLLSRMFHSQSMFDI